MSLRSVAVCSAGIGILASLAAVHLVQADDRPKAASADASASSTAADRSRQKEALAEFNDLIGGWRGVGMPRRGSTKGAWREHADWVWDFEKGVGIRYDVQKGKLLKTALLQFDPATRRYKLTATFADGKKRHYEGGLDDEGDLVLEAPEDDDGFAHRISITRLNEKRTLVLFQKRRAGQSFFTRVAEVGYTRDGTRLTTLETGGPECIVTGGAGTIAVKYKGKTYYVCCSGCRQAFEDDPEGVIAEAAARRAKSKDGTTKRR